MKLDTLLQKKAQEEQDILDLLAEDYRPALTVREIKVETGVRGLGHQGTGYSLLTIRLALARLRALGKVRAFGRRLGKQKRTLMWAQSLDTRWTDLTPDSVVCGDLGIPEYGKTPESSCRAQTSRAQGESEGGRCGC